MLEGDRESESAFSHFRSLPSEALVFQGLCKDGACCHCCGPACWQAETCTLASSASRKPGKTTFQSPKGLPCWQPLNVELDRKQLRIHVEALGSQGPMCGGLWVLTSTLGIGRRESLKSYQLPCVLTVCPDSRPSSRKLAHPHQPQGTVGSSRDVSAYAHAFLGCSGS